jgi:hypothetical protein
MTARADHTAAADDRMMMMMCASAGPVINHNKKRLPGPNRISVESVQDKASRLELRTSTKTETETVESQIKLETLGGLGTNGPAELTPSDGEDLVLGAPSTSNRY